MTTDVYPLQVLLVTLAGWINRHQQHVIEYLVEENRVLKGQMKGHRLRLTDDQRRRLAAKGRRLGRRLLRQVATLVTPTAGRPGDPGRPGAPVDPLAVVVPTLSAPLRRSVLVPHGLRGQEERRRAP